MPLNVGVHFFTFADNKDDLITPNLAALTTKLIVPPGIKTLAKALKRKDNNELRNCCDLYCRLSTTAVPSLKFWISLLSRYFHSRWDGNLLCQSSVSMVATATLGWIGNSASSKSLPTFELVFHFRCPAEIASDAQYPNARMYEGNTSRGACNPIM